MVVDVVSPSMSCVDSYSGHNNSSPYHHTDYYTDHYIDNHWSVGLRFGA